MKTGTSKSPVLRGCRLRIWKKYCGGDWRVRSLESKGITRTIANARARLLCVRNRYAGNVSVYRVSLAGKSSANGLAYSDGICSKFCATIGNYIFLVVLAAKEVAALIGH